MKKNWKTSKCWGLYPQFLFSPVAGSFVPRSPKKGSQKKFAPSQTFLRTPMLYSKTLQNHDIAVVRDEKKLKNRP